MFYTRAWRLLRGASTAVNMHSVGFCDSSTLVCSMEYSLIMYMSMHSTTFAGFLLFYTTFYKEVGVRMINSNKQICSLLQCMLELNNKC